MNRYGIALNKAGVVVIADLIRQKDSGVAFNHLTYDETFALIKQMNETIEL